MILQVIVKTVNLVKVMISLALMQIYEAMATLRAIQFIPPSSLKKKTVKYPTG